MNSTQSIMRVKKISAKLVTNYRVNGETYETLDIVVESDNERATITIHADNSQFESVVLDDGKKSENN